MKYIWKKNLQEFFWAHFFEHPYSSNGSKIPLDVALLILHWLLLMLCYPAQLPFFDER